MWKCEFFRLSLNQFSMLKIHNLRRRGCISGGVTYHVFTRMVCESYRRRLRSLLLYLCYVVPAPVNSLVCCFAVEREREREREREKQQKLYKIYNELVQCPIIKTKLVAHRHPASAVPTVNSLASSPPEMVPFLPLTIRDWNSLSKDAVEAKTVDTFVSRASH